MTTKDRFALDRMREDDFALELEYSEREYILREKTRTGPLIDTDPGDEQPEPKEKPTAERHNTKATCQR